MLFCQNCGATSPDNSHFCSQCGRSLSIPSLVVSKSRPYRSAYVRWAILAFAFIIVVAVVVKALPFIAFGSSSSVTTSSSPDFSSFVGVWNGHGRSLNFASNGHAQYSARVYQWCGPGVSLPCDSIQDNIIVDGINEQMVFIRTSGSTAYGTIVYSTAGDTGQSVTLTVQQNDTVILSFNNTPYNILCGPHAPAGYCGA